MYVSKSSMADNMPIFTKSTHARRFVRATSTEFYENLTFGLVADVCHRPIDGPGLQITCSFLQITPKNKNKKKIRTILDV
jgi:hypothetical protein